jgi:Trypsin
VVGGPLIRSSPRRLASAFVLAIVITGAIVGGAAPAGGVLGGTPIQVQAAPWTVFVQQDAGASRYICTGSVVDASHILTAAHCLYDDSGRLAQPDTLVIRAGISNFSSPAPSDAEQDRTVSSFRVHPGYSYTGSEAADDVAVLALPAPLDLSGPAVQAIALPSPGAAFPSGAQVGVAGFGKQDPSADASGPLVWMTGTVDPQGSCGQFSPRGLIDGNAITLCASSTSSAVCNGDSGSGLVTTTGGAPVLVGVVNAGAPGCAIGTHSVFAYVGAPEILEFVQGNDSPPTAPREQPSTNVDLRWNPPLVVGNTLSCASDGWPTPVQLSYSFTNTTTGQVLQSGARGTFAIPASAAGATIACEAAAANGGGTELVETEATAPVAAAPKFRIKPLALLTVTRGGRITVQVVVRAGAGIFGKVGACATLTHPVGGHLCHSISNPRGEPGPFDFTFAFRVRPTAPLGTSKIAISARGGLSSATATGRLRVAKA